MILLYRSNFIYNTWYRRWNLRIRAGPVRWIPFCSDIIIIIIIIIIWFIICNIMCVFHNNMTAWLCAMGRGGGVDKILTFRIRSSSERNVLYIGEKPLVLITGVRPLKRLLFRRRPVIKRISDIFPISISFFGQVHIISCMRVIKIYNTPL